MGGVTWVEIAAWRGKRRPARQDAYLRLHTRHTLFLAIVYVKCIRKEGSTITITQNLLKQLFFCFFWHKSLLKHDFSAVRPPYTQYNYHNHTTNHIPLYTVS